MNFIPEQPKQNQTVPFYDDVTSQDGWQGHTTNKSIETLKSEVSIAISRLGGLVVGFQRGNFITDKQQREGFRIHYTIEQISGILVSGQLDIAALPVKECYRQRKGFKTRQEKSLKMALYMLRNALDGTWFLSQLSPGYAPLMPWLLEQKSGKTITQLWSESTFNHLLPSGEGEFVEGEFTNV